MRITTLAFSMLFFSAAAAAEIARVEPPFWWQGFEETELQLMIYGDGIARTEPSIDAPGIALSRIERVESPNYLFLYLDISDAEPREFDIVFAGRDESLTHRYELLPKSTDPDHARGFSPRDAIYLITPDRFANGNPDNDTIDGMGDPVDRANPGGRHGGDIEGIRERLGYIKDLGFTAVWLNPVLENAMPSYSYHGYSTTDFYKVDPRFGSNEEYRAFVTDAKTRGIGVIMDMIVNHSGSEHWWMDDLPTSDWLNFPGDYVETSHQRTTWQDPYTSAYDAARFADGWFAPTMPDLNQRNPLMADYLIQNSLWWIEYLGLAGIRMDTYPYPDKDFMTEWTRRVMHEYPEFNVVGEEWSENPLIVSYWQAGKANHDGYVSYLPSLMDFPISELLKRALVAPEPQWGSSWEPLYVMLANDFVYPDPNALVVFPDNHDMARIFAQLDQDYDLFRMAIAYVLTMRGTPQIYYGTEILLTGPKERNDGLLRMDFPGGWDGDSVDGFTGAGLTDQQKEAQAFMRTLLQWRKGKSVIHDGKLMHFNPVRGVYAYFRYDDDDTVMIVFNKEQTAVSLDLGRFAEVLGDARSAVDVISGRGLTISDELELAPRSVMVLEISD